jgi:hypothetical protein
MGVSDACLDGVLFCLLQISHTDDQTEYITTTADHAPPHLVPRAQANKITSRICKVTSHTLSQARVKFRVQLPALARFQSQSRASPFRPPAAQLPRDWWSGSG